MTRSVDSSSRGLSRPGKGLPSTLQEHWRRTYASTPYRQLPWFSPHPSDWVRRAVEERWLSPGGRVLDVGCGAGSNALFLAGAGYQVAGVDLAPEAIEAARRRAQRRNLTIDFRVGDVLRLPYEARTFDGAVDRGCFHTLPSKLRPDFALELARVLKPKARYVLSWAAREATQREGPPHRISVEEVADVFESHFQFQRIEFSQPKPVHLAMYLAVLERRSAPQPPSR